jgi:hypothetical protein
MSAHAYTEDQLVEQPAIGLFAELGWQVARPPPNAGVAGEPADAGLLGAGGTRNPNRMNTAAVAISVIGPVSPAGEMAVFSKNLNETTGHGSGHDFGHESGTLFGSGLFSAMNPVILPDIYADI